MTSRAFGPVGSSTFGRAACRVRTTISIGFSKFVTCELTFMTSGFFSAATGVCSLIALSVISARGVASRFDTRGDVGDDNGLSVDSEPTSEGAFSVFSEFSVISGAGETDGSGVGRMDGFSSAMGLLSGAIDMRVLRLARMLCLPTLLRGDAFFTGEAGSSGATFSDASKISDGSIDSLARVLRVLPPVLGVGGSSTVFRLEPRVVRAGAGVNSSSLSLFAGGVTSSSSDSSMIFFRAAARRDGRVGEAADMLRYLLWFVRVV